MSLGEAELCGGGGQSGRSGSSQPHPSMPGLPRLSASARQAGVFSFDSLGSEEPTPPRPRSPLTPEGEVALRAITPPVSATSSLASAPPTGAACGNGPLWRRRRSLATVSTAPEETTCPICLESITTRAWRELSCGHCFHEGCILRWVQSAHHPHCPLCRFDLEVSALSEFEADFEAFRAELEAFRSAPCDALRDLLMVLVGAEHCRRRLFDAALARFLKLLGAAHGYEDMGLLGETRDLFNELLHELHSVREVLEKRRWSGGAAAEREAACGGKVVADIACGEALSSSVEDAELLNDLGLQLLRIHGLLKQLSSSDDSSSDGDDDGSPDRRSSVPPSPLRGGEICGPLREHLDQVRRLCRVYAAGFSTPPQAPPRLAANCSDAAAAAAVCLQPLHADE